MLLITNTINRMRLTMLHIIGTFCFILNTSINSDLLSRVYHTINRKTIPDAKKAGYHRHDDTLPLFFTNGSDLHCSCPVPPNRGGANGAPAGGAFLVDIPSRWKPRAKQQPNGLIAYSADLASSEPPCSSPVPSCSDVGWWVMQQKSP